MQGLRKLNRHGAFHQFLVRSCNCVGKRIGIILLRLFLAYTVWHYYFEFAPGENREGGKSVHFESRAFVLCCTHSCALFVEYRDAWYQVWNSASEVFCCLFGEKKVSATLTVIKLRVPAFFELLLIHWTSYTPICRDPTVNPQTWRLCPQSFHSQTWHINRKLLSVLGFHAENPN
jgi:hypothetical protein